MDKKIAEFHREQMNVITESILGMKVGDEIEILEEDLLDEDEIKLKEKLDDEERKLEQSLEEQHENI